MNQEEALEILEKWVANLHSGKFPQGKGELRSEEGRYCCAGVLTEQMIESKGEGFLTRKLNSEYANYEYVDEEATYYGVISATIPGKIDKLLQDANVFIDWNELYEKNDGTDEGEERQWTFPEIADFIERMYIIPLKNELGVL